MPSLDWAQPDNLADRRQAIGYALIGIAAMWASFGPGGGLYLLLMKVLHGVSMLRAPARLGIVVTFALAVLAGFGFRDLAGRKRWLTAATLAFLVVELWVPWPLQAMPPPAQAYRLLATLPRGGVVEFRSRTWRRIFTGTRWRWCGR